MEYLGGTEFASYKINNDTTTTDNFSTLDRII